MLLLLLLCFFLVFDMNYSCFTFRMCDLREIHDASCGCNLERKNSFALPTVDKYSVSIWCMGLALSFVLGNKNKRADGEWNANALTENGSKTLRSAFGAWVPSLSSLFNFCEQYLSLHCMHIMQAFAMHRNENGAIVYTAFSALKHTLPPSSVHLSNYHSRIKWKQFKSPGLRLFAFFRICFNSHTLLTETDHIGAFSTFLRVPIHGDWLQSLCIWLPLMLILLPNTRTILLSHEKKNFIHRN